MRSDEDVPTQPADPPRPEGSPPGTGTVPLDPAQHEHERHQRTRARRAAFMILCVALFGVVALQTVQARDSPHRLLTGALMALAVVALVQLLRVHRGLAYDGSYLAIAAVLVDLAGAAYVGLFSLVTVPLPVIIIFTTQDKRRGPAWAIYLTCAAGVLALGVLAGTGHLDQTRTLLALEAPPGRRLVSLTVFLELVLAISFGMAASFRRTSEQALRDLTRAHGELRDREVLLNRARADVERLNATNQAGRFAGRRIGPFQVMELAATGGMGEIYVARHVERGDLVALKVLHEHLSEQMETVQRFFREARITSDLDSVHIAKILMTGTSEEGSPFLAMEYLRGQDLGAILRQRTTMTLEETVVLVRQVSHALSLAHRAGVVHRDIKPSNLFLCATPDPAPCWKVVDFGISKVIGVSSTLTANAVIGTPGYMAPEQARGESVDARADVCSLGIVAYRALTGKPAFRGADSTTVITNVLLSLPLAPSLLADVPKDVDLVLALALAKNRADRFATIDELAQAFEAAATSSLDDAIRRRAHERLAVLPWGSEAEGPRRASAARAS